MSDDLYTETTNTTDDSAINATMENHRANAMAKFGTAHALYVGGSTSSVPTYDPTHNVNGYIHVVTSTWKKPPPEAKIEQAAAEGVVGTMGTAAQPTS